MVFWSVPLNKSPWLNVRDLWETYIIHVFFSFFFTARNLYVTSTIVMDRYALVPALLSRDQADSLLLLAFPFPLFLNMLSMVQRKCLYINIPWVIGFKVGWWTKSKLSIGKKIDGKKVQIFWGHTNLKKKISHFVLKLLNVLFK